MEKKVKIFGILNITPDSFSDGGKFLETESALICAQNLIKNGADFIDVGGESTRPLAVEIDAETEWNRIKNVLKILIKKWPKKISLDTRNPETANKFWEMGGRILNDVSGFWRSEMREIAPKFDQIIVNHFPGKTVAEVHEQKIDSTEKIRTEILFKKEQLKSAGVDPKNIILDPGIGFGKTMELNKSLLKFAALVPEEKVLIGFSRKRFLGENRFDPAPNIAAARTAIDSGAQFLRLHNPEWVSRNEGNERKQK